MTDLAALRNASSVIHDHLTQDASIIPDLADCLRTPGASLSSLYSIFPDDAKAPFQKRKLVPIPETVFQYYTSANVMSFMGLFPDIQRAWISIDHKLFLWDYMDGHEMSSFVDQPDVITHTALVRPKAGMFIDDINWLLVICTPVSVLLLALSYSTPTTPDHTKKSEIKLYATDLSVPSDTPMTSVIGTEDGRIFMCGADDGNLYELHYQEAESWFGKRIQLVNQSIGSVQSFLPRFATTSSTDHLVSLVNDPHRNCFYGLGSNNAISVFKPNGPKSVQHVQTLSRLGVAAQEKSPGSPAVIPEKFQIISLHIVSPAESRSGVYLMAFTDNGVRLYFGPSVGYGFSYGSSYGQTSGSLQLLHVRLPPSDLLHPDEQIRPVRPTPYGGIAPPTQPPGHRPFTVKGLRYSCYRDGITIASQPGDTQDSDFLLCMSPDLSRIGSLGQYIQPPIQPTYGPPYMSHSSQYRPLVEYATALSIAGNTWEIAPFPRSAPEGPPGTPSPIVTNELAMQFSEPPQQFMIFTNFGLIFLAKRRTVDFVKAILEELRTHGSTQQLVEFRDSYGRDQTCAMLLGLACGNSFLDCLEGIPPVTVEISNLAKQAFFDFGERPIWSERTTLGQSDGQGTTIFSGRREGFALYLSRLLRPVWKSKLAAPGSNGKPQSAISESIIVEVQRNLSCLRDFMLNNPHLFRSSPADTRGPSPDQEAWKTENQSLADLQSVLTRSIEALSFVLLLQDYHFGDLIVKCDADVQRIISDLTYEQLTTSQNGIIISRALVNVIIDQQIGQQISVDTVSEILQHRCGSFCSTEDVMLYKAKENVRKAVETRNPSERQQLLTESLRLFTKGASVLEIEKLREVIGDYQHLLFVQGAITLPLVSAAIIDSDGRGHEYWVDGAPMGDPRASILEKRVQCYDLVLHSLELLENSSSSSPSGESLRGAAYELAFASEDEIFHSTLYDWLIDRGLADQLLETRPTFLEAHLRRPPINVVKYQLLWQFYVKNGQPLRAAEVLVALAGSSEFNLSLQERVEYLTLAASNAKSHPISLDGHHESAIAFLTELEETLEVAQVQLEIWNHLADHVGDGPEVRERILLLSQKLLTISELFQDYAVPFDLPEIKLLCLQVSEHKDDNILRPIWTSIIEGSHDEDTTPAQRAETVARQVETLGRRFYPSESAFPLQHVAWLMVRFSLQHSSILPKGWAPRILVQCGVPYNEVWTILHEMYESQVPPFNDQRHVQSLSSDISVLLVDWIEKVLQPHSMGRAEMPAGRLDTAIDQYLKELDARNTDARTRYEEVKRKLRRHW